MSITLVYLLVFGAIFIIGRLILIPIKTVMKLIYNGIIGAVSLWLINIVGGYFNFAIDINPITALIAGILGVPGVLALLAYQLFS